MHHTSPPSLPRLTTTLTIAQLSRLCSLQGCSCDEQFALLQREDSWDHAKADHCRHLSSQVMCNIQRECWAAHTLDLWTERQQARLFTCVWHTITTDMSGKEGTTLRHSNCRRLLSDRTMMRCGRAEIGNNSRRRTEHWKGAREGARIGRPLTMDGKHAFMLCTFSSSFCTPALSRNLCTLAFLQIQSDRVI